jgi:D-alanine-D-alanine ligase
MDILKGKKVAVLYGGTSAEREISLLTGKAVLDSFRRMNVDVVGIDVQGPEVVDELKKHKIDFAFISLHGPLGEDGTIQGALEVLGIPYSGSKVTASAISMNKVMTKCIWLCNGIPTPSWKTVFSLEEGLDLKVQLPVVVKPASQGSAIGVSIVKTLPEYEEALKNVFKLDKEALVEQYVQGTELTVAVLGGKALSPIEIVPVHEFYDFHSKYKPGQSSHVIPPRLPENVIEMCKVYAVEAARVLGCKGTPRVDIIVDKDHSPWLLEINTIPGMTETSLLPDAAKASGMSFDQLVQKIVELSIG